MLYRENEHCLKCTLCHKTIDTMDKVLSSSYKIILNVNILKDKGKQIYNIKSKNIFCYKS